jgi:cell division transport system permease protein
MARGFRFFSLEAIRSIRSNAAISFAATATVLIAIATLGIFLSVFSWTQSQINGQKEKLDLRAFIKLDASEADIKAAVTAVQAHPNVKSIQFLSRAEVLKQEAARLPGIITPETLPNNPFPATIIIKPKDPGTQQQIITDLSTLPYWLKDGTTKTGFSADQKTTKDFLSAAKVLRWGAFGLMLILVIAAILLIGNTIRLSIFARRREVEVMRLVGATNWFIRWPFVIEGLIFGLIGAIAAVLLLIIGKVTVIDRLLKVSESPLQQQTDSTIGLPPLALILILAGALLGALGSGITLRRFLRV